ncbi:MAG: hypothetical protein D6702_13115, partial [Planctomycetota bacterium]
YFLSGTITFTLPGPKEVTQDCEVSLGGPDRLRYALAAGGAKNVFLLRDAETAWVRSGDEDYRPYPARQLAVQTWLRWLACRFPWDLADPIRSLPPGARALEVDGPVGRCRIEVDADGLPRVLEHEEARLELTDWRAVSADGSRLPATWSWRLGAVGQTERFDRIEEGALFFDRAFEPPGMAPPELRWSSEAWTEAGTGPAADRITIVRRPAGIFLRGPADGSWHQSAVAAGAAEPVLWSWLDEQGRPQATVAARAAGAEAPPGTEAVRIPAGLWLRWLSHAPDSDPTAAATALREGAAQGGLEPAGPVWVRLPPPGRSAVRHEYLLPLRD